MKIEWNKVTVLSKIVALALFVSLPFIGFYYGIRYGEMAAYLSIGARATNSAIPAAGGASDYYKNVAEWQTDRSDTGNFSIAYPIDFPTGGPMSEDLTREASDWRVGGNGTPGAKLFTLTIPKTFEPQTNFNDALLMVGMSKNRAAVSDCLAADSSGGPATPTSTMNINGVTFTVFHSDGAGAGNYYETTSYRTLHAGACYSVEYTLHSSQIANYPAEYQLHPFNKTKLTDLLDRIAGTFRLE